MVDPAMVSVGCWAKASCVALAGVLTTHATSKVNGLALLSLLGIETVPLKLPLDAASH